MGPSAPAKRCLDENGFECHAQSEPYLRQLVIGEFSGKQPPPPAGSLAEFVKHHGHMDIARAEVNILAWIDSSPKALAKANVRGEDRATTSDGQRERLFITEQTERAKAESSSAGSPRVQEGLKRDVGAETVVLSFSVKRAPVTFAAAAPAFAFKATPLKPANLSNPLERLNVFKAPASKATIGNGRRRVCCEELLINRL
ncbi:hypothetical protein C8R47DRAFT_1174642 [Mycena vitilis]|nr:hypothetical protein C8R47DRAFT_1174642 [Mycena vitilis]